MIKTELQLLGGRGAGAFAAAGRKMISDYIKKSTRRAQPLDASRYGSMLEAEGQIRGLVRERALVYEDIAASPVSAFQGTSTSVALPSRELTSTRSLTHNHPDRIHGGTFSFADISTHTTTGIQRTRAAATEGTYYLKSTSRSRPTAFNRRVASDIPMLERRMQNASRKLARRASRKEITWKQARTMQRQVVTGELHRYYQDTAPAYGYIYGKQKRNRTYR